jgi:hypothetical protein
MRRRAGGLSASGQSIDIHLSRPTVCPSGSRIWSRIDVIERPTNSSVIETVSGAPDWCLGAGSRSIQAERPPCSFWASGNPASAPRRVEQAIRTRQPPIHTSPVRSVGAHVRHGRPKGRHPQPHSVTIHRTLPDRQPHRASARGRSDGGGPPGARRMVFSLAR